MALSTEERALKLNRNESSKSLLNINVHLGGSPSNNRSRIHGTAGSPYHNSNIGGGGSQLKSHYFSRGEFSTLDPNTEHVLLEKQNQKIAKWTDVIDNKV